MFATANARSMHTPPNQATLARHSFSTTHHHQDTMRVAGLFSGIGGLELPFRSAGAATELLCDNWEPSQAVLRRRFPDVPLWKDVRDLRDLPEAVDVVTAGFPCTDLSQAGRTRGIRGAESGLVSNVFRLLKNRNVKWLVLENVRNMLVLDGGRAMAFLTSELEALGFRWAYRVVDSRFSGVPQRRHRVIMVASRSEAPERMLFADDAGPPKDASLRNDAWGFYWTEGLRGLGWAKDAVPPLKGGSAVGIPSPPCVWLPTAKPGYKLVMPSIEDAEAMQGFRRGWTRPAQERETRNGPRWKLVGNAVSAGVGRWIASRLQEPGDPAVDFEALASFSRWPEAACGGGGQVWMAHASHWPIRRRYRHLLDVMRLEDATPLSGRAARGFLSRTERSSLRFQEEFLADLREHVELQSAPSLMPAAAAG